MSIEAKPFDDKKAESELKKCPKIVRDYVKLLKKNNENWQLITNKAIAKMRKLSELIPSNTSDATSHYDDLIHNERVIANDDKYCPMCSKQLQVTKTVKKRFKVRYEDKNSISNGEIFTVIEDENNPNYYKIPYGKHGVGGCMLLKKLCVKLKD